ncbi:MAG: hypothetical protein IPO92_13520 [Saprospiraceae bacterium]|nr:hypothetical protein [Saprospiraceae bacterium]
MTLTALKSILKNVDNLQFNLPNGEIIPTHFHITEAGILTKNFIDCGGKVRIEKSISFQIWVAADIDHRLSPSKLLQIIHASEKVIGQEDLDIDIEYQTDTIGKYGLDYNGHNFSLTPKFTNCLAQDHCGIPMDKLKVNLADLVASSSSCCTPGGGCC